MENTQRPTKQAEELFLGEEGADSPTIGPLRINKSSPAPSSTNADNYKSPYQYPIPSHSPAAQAPPYPEDRVRSPAQRSRQGTPANDRQQTTTSNGAEETRSRRVSSNQAPHQRYRFDANDPNRPTISGYSVQAPPTGRNAERRGGTPKPLPDSPGPETPDKDEPVGPAPGSQHYFPPPSASNDEALHVPDPAGINRLDSTASASTTRAQRGSPPPPDTPISQRPGANRFAATLPATSSSIQAQNGAAQQRASPYPAAGPTLQTQQGQQAPDRPWSPSERPGGNPYGPTMVYQGMQEITPTTSTSQAPLQSPQPAPSQQASQPSQQSHSMFSGPELARLNLHEEPPPAYSPVNAAGGTTQTYPAEKRGSVAGTTSPSPMRTGQQQAQDPSLQRHPAFANDPQAGASSTPRNSYGQGQGGQNATAAGPSPSTGPASPPPLPEGWIAHLDQNSGQYYYIHLPTQSTQWEFPKGPTPLAMQEPMSPTGSFVNPLQSPTYTQFPSTFPSKPLASPGFPTQQAPYRDSVLSMPPSVASPTTTAFTGPPPTAGVDMYKVAPTNGVYFGPYLRYTNIDLERGLWLGSILLVTDTSQPPTIHIHQSSDLSPNPRQLKANPIYSHQRFLFYRYDVDLMMDEHPNKWTYAITSHLGCTRYEFLVAGRYETSWRFIAHSGNDFALSVNANERSKLGGVGLMWKDVLQKHLECGGFHAQVGLGGQIYADRLWQDVPMLRQWITMSGKENRKNSPWSPKLEEDVIHAYFHYYTSHFDQPHLREAFAQIPNILALDDHDIFDGYGSYPDYMQHSNMFKNIGRIGTDMYLLFQHHTTHEILRNVNNDLDLFTLTGNGWHFVKYLGPAVVLIGPDTRSERTTTQVMAGPTYQGLFPKVALLPPSVQHCIWLIPVPLIYPRLQSVQQIANTVQTGKKAVTGTFNMLGKVTSSVAGIVGAKEVVNDGFHQVKKAVGKSGLMSGMLSPFGEIDVLDELRDMWTHESKDLERTYIIRTLQGIAHNKSLRMTFLSGSVNACGAGLVHDPSHPSDHKTMYQLISASIVNAPPSSMVLRMLNINPKQAIYVPQNGRRSSTTNASANQGPQVTDTKEDMMEIFVQDVNGAPREQKRLMGRRNYIAMVAYDPEVVQGAFGGSQHGNGQQGSDGNGGGSVNGKASGRLSLAADFMVQSEGAYSAPVKYGPVVVPCLEYGR